MVRCPQGRRLFRPTPAAYKNQIESAANRKPLALVGFMGSGKSVVGALVAQRAQARFFDLDLMVEDEAGMPIADMFATHSEAAFRALEKRLLPNALQPDAVAALGGGAVLDDGNWQLISQLAISIWIDVPFATLWQRVRGMRNRPLLIGRSEAEVEALLLQRLPRYQQASHRVDGDRPIEMVTGEVLRLWSA